MLERPKFCEISNCPLFNAEVCKLADELNKSPDTVYAITNWLGVLAKATLFTSEITRKCEISLKKNDGNNI